MNKKHSITRSKLTIIFISLVILMDQIIKIIAISVTNGGTVEVIKGVLNFTYIKNTGGAFGIGSDASMFLLINIIVIFLLIRFLVVNKEKIEIKAATSLSLILAGGISNLIDRVFRGGVVDFIDISPLINFPKFNFADICIVGGWILFAFFAAILTSEQIKDRKHRLAQSKERQENANNRKQRLKEKIEKWKKEGNDIKGGGESKK